MTHPDRPSGSAAVELIDVHKGFGDVHAVNGVDLTVSDGELLALVGPSGCGKSTLLRLIAGLTRCDAGRVHIRGTPVDGPETWRAPERRHVGIVFQDHALFPHLSVAGNVAFGLPQGRRTNRGERDRRVAEVLDLVAMTGFGERFPHELSGGEAQRVALARALAPGPEVILLDEPFSDLDRGLRGEVRGHTVEVLRQAGAAALFVTHDHEEALAVGDRVAVMRGGQLEQVAAPPTVFHSPHNRFVATFMGEAAFLPAERHNGHLVTEAGPVTAPANGASSALQVMVRPHDVVFEPDPTGPATLVGAEFQGAFILYTLELASGQRLRSLRPHTDAHPVGTRARVRLEHGHDATVFAGHQAVAVATLPDAATSTSRAG